MATEYGATFTLSYMDKTTRNVTFDSVNTASLSGISGKVHSFNSGLTVTTISLPSEDTGSMTTVPIGEGLVSDNGASCTGITGATISAVESTRVYDAATYGG